MAPGTSGVPPGYLRGTSGDLRGPPGNLRGLPGTSGETPPKTHGSQANLGKPLWSIGVRGVCECVCVFMCVFLFLFRRLQLLNVPFFSIADRSVYAQVPRASDGEDVGEGHKGRRDARLPPI